MLPEQMVCQTIFGMGFATKKIPKKLDQGVDACRYLL
jgi:hypothetical protein